MHVAPNEHNFRVTTVQHYRSFMSMRDNTPPIPIHKAQATHPFLYKHKSHMHAIPTTYVELIPTKKGHALPISLSVSTNTLDQALRHRVPGTTPHSSGIAAAGAATTGSGKGKHVRQLRRPQSARIAASSFMTPPRPPPPSP